MGVARVLNRVSKNTVGNRDVGERAAVRRGIPPRSEGFVGTPAAGDVIDDDFVRRSGRADAITVVDRSQFPTVIHLFLLRKRFVSLHVLPWPYGDVLDQHVVGDNADASVF